LLTATLPLMQELRHHT